MIIEISLDDFLQFLKKTRYGAKLGKRNIAQESVDFAFDGKCLIISVFGLTYPIPARGTWEGTVSIPPHYIKGFAKAPPSQNPLSIGYSDSRLKIGSTLFPAKWS